MDDFDQYLKQKLKDPAFEKEWNELELEHQVQEALIKARTEAHMTQAELAEKSGIRQSNISRIENGNAVPRLDTLYALASAMDKKVKITLL